jgi:hypothetical protein
VIPDLAIQSLDRIVKPACIEKCLWIHNAA